MFLHVRAVIRHQLRLHAQTLLYGAPPIRLVQLRGCVIRFAVVEIRHADRAVLCHLPAFVCADDLRPAVAVGNPQLRQQRLTVCRHAIDAREHERPDRPAARDRRGDAAA